MKFQLETEREAGVKVVRSLGRHADFMHEYDERDLKLGCE